MDHIRAPAHPPRPEAVQSAEPDLYRMSGGGHLPIEGQGDQASDGLITDESGRREGDTRL